VVFNNPVSVAEGGQVTINTTDLQFIDDNSPPADVTYTVTFNILGQLELSKSICVRC